MHTVPWRTDSALIPSMSLLVLASCLCCASYGSIPSAAKPVQPRLQGSPWEGPSVAVIRVEQNPSLAPEGLNGMHDDSWGTNSIPWAGPMGKDPIVQSMTPAAFGGEFATLCFDSKGRIIGVSGQLARFQLFLLDPGTMRPLAVQDLPPRASMRKFLRSLDFRVLMTDTSGGGYFHLGTGDREGRSYQDRQLRRCVHAAFLRSADQLGDR